MSLLEIVFMLLCASVETVDIWFICTFYSPFEQEQDASKCSPEMLSKLLPFIQQQNLQKLSAVICLENKHLETQTSEYFCSLRDTNGLEMYIVDRNKI